MKKFHNLPRKKCHCQRQRDKFDLWLTLNQTNRERFGRKQASMTTRKQCDSACLRSQSHHQQANLTARVSIASSTEINTSRHQGVILTGRELRISRKLREFSIRCPVPLGANSGRLNCREWLVWSTRRALIPFHSVHLFYEIVDSLLINLCKGF